MEDFTRRLAAIAELKKAGKWEELLKIIAVGLNRVLRTSPQEFRRLTETGLLAQLIKGTPTVWVPYKKIMLIALLKETGDYAAMKDPPGGGYVWYLKALHLLLDALAHDELHGYQQLVPTVDSLLAALGDRRVPVRTRLLLAREFESRGQFGRVRDEFLAALRSSPDNSRLVGFGMAILERIGRENDATLAAGGLLRREIEATMADLIHRSAEESGGQSKA
jgi:hypothetical protein